MNNYISSIMALYRLLRYKSSQFIIDYYKGDDTHVSRMNDDDQEIGFVEFINRILRKPDHIIDNIYLGNAYNASNSSLLKEMNIKYIINVTKEIPNHFQYQNIQYLQINVMDRKNDSMILHFDHILNFLQNINNNDNVLIHCYMGSSRSATAVLIHLIKNYQMELSQALQLLKEKRNIVNINKKFIDEVKQYFSI